MSRRWIIAVLLLLLSALNYVDRQALSILAKTIQERLGIDDVQYGRIGAAFLACYALAYLAAGRIVDRVGPRLAETLFVLWWSAAGMLTGLVSEFWGLLACRCLLGLGEPGHYAVAAKSVGRLFSPAERGLAVSMYTMGGTLGAALAAPLVAFLAVAHGWRAAFVAIGAAGVAFALLWWTVYRDPPDAIAAKEPPRPLGEVLSWRPVWIILAVRALTDSVWYFYLVWFAKYLQDRRDYSLEDVGGSLWIVFVAADIGCLLAGTIAAVLIRRGMAPVRARSAFMAVCAVAVATNFAVPHHAWVILHAGLVAGAALAFMTAAVALPIDLFPTGSLGTVQGVVGTGGALAGAVSTALVGWAVTHWSYDAVFAVQSVLHPLAIVILLLDFGRIRTGWNRSYSRTG